MRAQKEKRTPRPKKARALLAVAGGLALTASLAISSIGCESEVGNPAADLSGAIPDVGNPMYDMRKSD